MNQAISQKGNWRDNLCEQTALAEIGNSLFCVPQE